MRKFILTMSDPMSAEPLFKIVFVNQGKIYEVFARKVHQDHLYGFVTMEQFVFGTQSGVVVDPSEEKLKSEFDGVKRSSVPMHAVIRIDEVSQQGTARISEAGANVTPFPGPVYTPGNDRSR